MYQKITLRNGVRVVAERIDHVRSAAIGVWIGNGSRFESAEQNGISHFIEHMIFKGTEKRTARHIASMMDAMGGQSNAFTTKDCTCYYMKVLDTHLHTAAELLADMFLCSSFADEDIELERGVVLEEIDMYEDTPEDVATEKLFEACYEGTALGRPILGAEETLARMDSKALHDYVRKNYHPEDTVVALSGSFSDADLDYICELFGEMQGSGRNQIEPAHYQPRVVIRSKEIEQNHLCLGFPGLPLLDDKRYAYQLMNAIIGGGMSSRLFQTVRERNGMCYSIYSFPSSHVDTGMFSIYVGLGQEDEAKAAKLICNVLRDFCAEGPTREELSRCREQLKSNLLMGLESTNARMHHLGRYELFTDHVVSSDELVAAYDAVTADQVRALANEVFRFDQASICAVGNTGDEAYYRSLIG
ncbi:peptidase M16 [Butyricicoccus pullicaecorum]|uniref:Peptidase M16 n=1 Tax=Butyricicoccus pullicaecorum TaxID=501571 RepID=A0A1Y4LBE5_9FIRM|nr:pitrilysin family protein [Butyricicoccus pullicaecorum]OUP54046.1 peptidase M16 [Butyricicoccus pullicaecorum]